jgi:DNA-binding XRE family transcriptional regulator
MDGRQRAARAVAARRGELRMTQRELGAAAGVDTKTIGNLEKRGVWPIARTRAPIEKALGWPVGEMERIAAQEEEKQPVIPPALLALIPDLLALIKRRFPPDKQQEAVDALAGILLPTEYGEDGRPDPARRAS